MRGCGQVAPEQQREGRTCQAGQGQQQGGARRGPSRGQLPRDPGDGGGRVANIFYQSVKYFQVLEAIPPELYVTNHKKWLSLRVGGGGGGGGGMGLPFCC